MLFGVSVLCESPDRFATEAAAKAYHWHIVAVVSAWA
jgi:hypothetical protein